HANLEEGVKTTTFQLGCTPIINLFPQSAEPLALTQTRIEYRVVPSRTAPLDSEIYSIDEVTCLDPGRPPVEVQPFYSFAYDQDRDSGRAFWCARRRASPIEDDRGTEVHLVIVDRDFDPRLPAEAMLDVHTTCSNRDVPARLQRAGDELLPEDRGLDLPGP